MNADNSEGYDRELYLINPKLAPIIHKQKNKDVVTTVTTTISSTTTTTTTKSANTQNVNVNYEFELPMLNTSRLLLDDAYRQHVQDLFFNKNNNQQNDITFDNKTDDLIVKECKCERISCICCVNIVIDDLNFEHKSCVNITYDKGYEVTINKQLIISALISVIFFNFRNST